MADYEQSRAFGGVVDVLEAVGAVYAIWGGLAVAVYGEPRFTQDMDILLSPEQLNVAAFGKRLRESDYHVDERAVRRALAGGSFNIIHLHYAIKTDFYVPQERELKAMIAGRVYLPFDEMRRAAYVTADSVVIAKLHAYEQSHSTRHLEDVASIIRVQGNKLAQAAIDVVAARLGLLGVWRALWAENLSP